MLEVSVEDNGPGIAADNVRKILQPFVTTKPDGLGLGLSLCRTIIEDHGGELRVAPAKPRGLVASFTLPVGRG